MPSNKKVTMTLMTPEEMEEDYLQEVKKMISKAEEGERLNEARWEELHARPAPPMLIEIITKDYHEAKAGLAKQKAKLEELKQQIEQRKEARSKTIVKKEEL